MTVLPARAAYAQWAATYEPETAISFLESLVVESLELPTDQPLLDVGCGTGRRLPEGAIGIDASEDMLRHSPERRALAVSDARSLPFGDGAFGVAWCRLMIGHIPALRPAYEELARVVRRGGSVVITDLAPDAARAGHRRTFRDHAGVVREVEHYVHDADMHLDAARRAKLELVAEQTAVVGPDIRHFYADAGRLATYDEQVGLALVIAFWFRRT